MKTIQVGDRFISANGLREYLVVKINRCSVRIKQTLHLQKEVVENITLRNADFSLLLNFNNMALVK